jgi:hypothetical protein
MIAHSDFAPLSQNGKHGEHIWVEYYEVRLQSLRITLVMGKLPDEDEFDVPSDQDFQDLVEILVLQCILDEEVNAEVAIVDEKPKQIQSLYEKIKTLLTEPRNWELLSKILDVISKIDKLN